MKYIKQVLSFKEIRDLTKEKVEVSAALYMRDNGIVYLSNKNNGYSNKGDKYGVEFPGYEEVVKRCRELGANKIILVHNHPPIDGEVNTEPSRLDIESTENYIYEIARYGCVLVDHIIISKEGYYSFRMNNLI